MSNELIYTGDQTKLPIGAEPYLPSQDLIDAVNVAIALQRPLLLQGEPGSGKTRLAQAVAQEFGLEKDKHYFEWFVKSNSQAQEGLYAYDALGRLRDVQLAASDSAAKKRLQNVEHHYIKLGPLGQAFTSDKRSIVLIDEIDKADIDFPNDLLRELDQQEFTIQETTPPRTFPATHRPIIFITSNQEKNLSDAFLRRCLFFYIDFPHKERLQEIVSRHVALALNDRLVELAVGYFWDLHKRMAGDKGPGSKLVSTSELIDWAKILKRHYHIDEQTQTERLEDDLSADKMLFPSVLLKTVDDLRKYGPAG